MAVGFDLRAPMLVDASAAIRPDHSCCDAVPTKAVRALEASLGHGSSRLRQRNMKMGPTPPTPWAAKRSASISAGARPFKHPRGRGQRRNDRPRPPSSISRLGRRRILEAGFAATGDPKKRPPLRRPFDPCNCSAIRPRLRRLDPSRRAGRPRSQGPRTRASSSPRWTAPAPWSSSPSTWRWR